MELGDFITKYWQILGAVVGFIISFTVLKLQNADQEKRIVVLEKKADEHNATYTLIQTQLAEIKTQLAFLLKRYDEHQ